jgi:hypothetical protein
VLSQWRFVGRVPGRAVDPVSERVLVAPVVDVIEDPGVAPGQVDRLEDRQVDAVLDVAVGVAWRPVEIHDQGVSGIVRIDLAFDVAGQVLVLSDAPEGQSLERGGVGLRDDDVGYPCARGLGLAECRRRRTCRPGTEHGGEA